MQWEKYQCISNAFSTLNRQNKSHWITGTKLQSQHLEYVPCSKGTSFGLQLLTETLRTKTANIKNDCKYIQAAW